MSSLLGELIIIIDVLLGIKLRNLIWFLILWRFFSIDKSFPGSRDIEMMSIICFLGEG